MSTTVPTTLPPLLVLTDRTQTSRPLVDVIRAAIDGGARAVVLREKDLPREERVRLADQLRPLLHDVDGIFLVASDATIAAAGVHLAGNDPFPSGDNSCIRGRSCHDTTELRAAATESCDYATLSPIFTTTSKPGYGPALGPEALADPPLPTYALGGITETNAAHCLRSGATGIALVGTVMRAEHPELITAALLGVLAGVGA